MGKVSRREFLVRTGVGAAAGASLMQLAGAEGFAAEAGSKPPNILVIMADEHQAGVLGCYGNKLARTPNMDALAGRGIRFDACYTNSPLCVPGRLSFTSGKYISRVSAWNNHCMLPPDTPSIPRVMNAAGYDSFLCGKMHYDSTCRYGFAEVGPNMNHNFMTGRGKRSAFEPIEYAPGYSGRFKQYGAGEGSVINHDKKVTESTVDFLSKRKKDDKPFFLLAGYLAPHFPLIVPQKYWDNFKGKIPMPQIPPGHLDSLPQNYKLIRAGFNVEDVPPEQVQKARELYYALTQWLDEEVGKVLAALGKSEVADNTVVIYTADHGEDLGEHGMWFKNCMFEQGARVPLIVSWPKRWKGGQARSQACSLVDLVQTIADLGGTKAPKDWNGASMCGWMDNQKAPWRDLAITQYYAHHIASGFTMIRTGKYKYVYHAPADDKHPAQRELYDLKADPGEFKNLAGDPQQKPLIESLHEKLVKEIGEAPEKTEARCRAELAKGYGRPEPAAKAGARRVRKREEDDE